MAWIPLAIQGGLSLMQMLKAKGGGDGAGFQAEGGSPFSYLQQIPGTLQKYSAPYTQMWQDPGGTMAGIGKGFQQSPGYQYQLGQALQAGGQAAAAGGMAGSPMQQQQAQTTATGLANQDYYNYLNHAMSLYTTGVQGYSNLGENLARNLMSESQLAENERMMQLKSEMQEQSDSSGLFGSALGGIGSALGQYFGSKGGAAAGGGGS